MTYTQEMSNMALTITRSKRNSIDGSRITAFRTVAFDNPYPAGGEPFDASAECGLKSVEEVRIGAGLPAGFTVRYDYATKKLQLFGESTEASGDAVNPGTNPAAETRPLAEFADTFDASGIDALELIIKGTRS
jgi:hypothetical protein